MYWSYSIRDEFGRLLGQGSSCKMDVSSYRSQRDSVQTTLSMMGTRAKAVLRHILLSKSKFPDLNDAVEYSLKLCLACQSVTDRQNRFDPLQMSNMLLGHWENLSTDF